MLNLYEILEVSERASKEVIEKAYKVLAKKYHPDLQQEKEIAEEKMKQINEAYEILSDKEKREKYDLQLKEYREEQKKKEKQKMLEEQQRILQEEKKTNEIKRNERNVNYTNTAVNQEQNYYKAYADAYNNYWRSMRI